MFVEFRGWSDWGANVIVILWKKIVWPLTGKIKNLCKNCDTFKGRKKFFFQIVTPVREEKILLK